MPAFALRILRRAAPALTMIRFAMSLPPHARALGGDLADLGARRGAAGLARGSALEVVRTAAVRVVDGVHGDAADARPAHALGAHRMELLAGLHERLVAAAAARDQADGGPGEGVELAELAGRHAHDGLAGLGVRDDLGGRAGGLDELAAVVGARLDVVDGRALGDLRDDGDVAGLDLRGGGDADAWADEHPRVGVVQRLVAARGFGGGEAAGGAGGGRQLLDGGGAG